MATSSITSGSNGIDTPLTIFLIQLIMIVSICRILTYLFKFIKQPSVIAEVVTGIILGPSALGRVDSYMTNIWAVNTTHKAVAGSLTTFNVIANVGLILFMFMVGLELDTKLMKSNVKSAIGISVTAMITPFALGLLSSWAIHSALDVQASFGNFLLFVGVAMSITAFPVLARILSEFKLLETRVGNIALSSAAIDDVTAWCLLALVVAIARSSGPLNALWTFLLLIGFLVVMYVFVRPFLTVLAHTKNNNPLEFKFMVIILISVFVCSWFTEIIGVHAIFGGFILGTCVPRKRNLNMKIIERIEDVVVILLLPLYFTYSGLRTDIGSLNSAVDWGLVILVIATACIGKITGATLASRFIGISWRESITIGFLMNTKGLVELIVLNVGLEVGVLNTQVFTIFVIMALITTFITSPAVHFIYLRHRHKYVTNQGTDRAYRVVATVKNDQSSTSMVRILGSLFCQISDRLAIKTLFTQEISDRPSSYFLSQYYSMWQDAPLVKSDKKELRQNVKNNPTLSSMQVSSRVLASGNMASDLVDYVLEGGYNILVMNFIHTPVAHKNPLEKQPSSSSNLASLKFDLQHSHHNLTNLMNNQFKNVSALIARGDIIDEVVAHNKSAMGVLVRKSPTFSPDPIERILFIHRGAQFDSFALEVVCSLIAAKHSSPASTIKSITIVTSTNSELNVSAVQNGPEVHIVRVEDPYLYDDYSEEQFQMVIMGGDRDSAEIFSLEIVASSFLPVLVLYPGKKMGRDHIVDIADKDYIPLSEKGSSNSSGSSPRASNVTSSAASSVIPNVSNPTSETVKQPQQQQQPLPITEIEPRSIDSESSSSSSDESAV